MLGLVVLSLGGFVAVDDGGIGPIAFSAATLSVGAAIAYGGFRVQGG